VRGYLLDSHVLLWWLSDPERLSEEALDVLKSRESVVFVSAASVWELAIKRRLGRLDFPSNLTEVIADASLHPMPVQLGHALATADLPLHHRDPFDRLLVAQARLGQLTLITHDLQLEAYDVQLLHA
jgi:PIN domain nuclease of toxin-antitoxin system